MPIKDDIFESANKSVAVFELSHKLSKVLEWDKWIKEIPFIPFSKKWEVKIIPPTQGAIVRFRVRIRKYKDAKYISVYLDCYDILGSFGSPYWEIYPNKEGDVSRIPMNDMDELLAELKEAFKYLYKDDNK